MNARELETKIFEELKSVRRIRTRCGIGLAEIPHYLIPPVREKYLVGRDKQEFWLVFADSLETPDYGTQIIYCEWEEKFATALSEGRGKLFLRYYPSFVEALEGM